MLTFQFVPWEEIFNLDSERKVQKLLRIVKQQKIVVMEGQLGSNEEAMLIEATMELINSKFKGVEIGIISPQNTKSEELHEKIKSNLINLILGKRRGLTIVGPANIVKEIKKDPNKLQLFMASPKKRGK